MIDVATMTSYENYLSGQVILNGKSVNTFMPTGLKDWIETASRFFMEPSLKMQEH